MLLQSRPPCVCSFRWVRVCGVSQLRALTTDSRAAFPSAASARTLASTSAVAVARARLFSASAASAAFASAASCSAAACWSASRIARALDSAASAASSDLLAAQARS